MPYYDFECTDCGQQIQTKATIAEKEAGLQLACPECGSEKTQQLFNGLAFAGSFRQSVPQAAPQGPCGGNCACFPQ